MLIDCMIFLSQFPVVVSMRCQQFLSWHSETVEFSARRMLSFDL